MPCGGYPGCELEIWPDDDTKLVKLKREVSAALDELKGISHTLKKGSDKLDDNDMEKRLLLMKADNDKLTQMICTISKIVDISLLPENIQLWIKDHERYDVIKDTEQES